MRKTLEWAPVVLPSWSLFQWAQHRHTCFETLPGALPISMSLTWVPTIPNSTTVKH